MTGSPRGQEARGDDYDLEIRAVEVDPDHDLPRLQRNDPTLDAAREAMLPYLDRSSKPIDVTRPGARLAQPSMTRATGSPDRSASSLTN